MPLVSALHRTCRDPAAVEPWWCGVQADVDDLDAPIDLDDSEDDDIQLVAPSLHKPISTNARPAKPAAPSNGNKSSGAPHLSEDARAQAMQSKALTESLKRYMHDEPSPSPGG